MFGMTDAAAGEKPREYGKNSRRIAYIPARGFITGLLGGMTSVFCAFFYGTGRLGFLSLRGTLMFTFLALLTVAAWRDIDAKKIDDSLCLMILALSILALWLFPEVLPGSRLLGIFAVSVPMLLLSLLIPGAFGGGDIKLMAVCGGLLGWKSALAAFCAGIAIGGAYCMVLLMAGRISRKEPIALGPFLVLGFFITVFSGGRIADWLF